MPSLEPYDRHFEKSTPQALDEATARLANDRAVLSSRARFDKTDSPFSLARHYVRLPSHGPDETDASEGPEEASPATPLIKIGARDRELRELRYRFYNELPSTPLGQFMSQSARERQRLEHQQFFDYRGRRQTLPWDETVGMQGSAENNIRRSWVNQGIWAQEWGPAWAEYANIMFSWEYVEPGAERVVPGHPFRDLRWEPDFFKAFPNSWGHEKPPDDAMTSQISHKSMTMPPIDLGPLEKLVPDVKRPQASTPAEQFKYQMRKERDWIEDETNFQARIRGESSTPVDLDALAREGVRKNWILDGIWQPAWDDNEGGIPSGQWLHEVPIVTPTAGPPETQPAAPSIPWAEQVRMARSFKDGRGIDRWLTRAQAKILARLCGVGWRDVRAACQPRPDAITDDESSEEEEVAGTHADTAVHESASHTSVTSPQGMAGAHLDTAAPESASHASHASVTGPHDMAGAHTDAAAHENTSHASGASLPATGTTLSHPTAQPSSSGSKRKAPAVEDEEEDESSPPPKRQTPRPHERSPAAQSVDESPQEQEGPHPSAAHSSIEEPGDEPVTSGHSTTSQTGRPRGKRGPAKGRPTRAARASTNGGDSGRAPPRRNPPRAARAQGPPPAPAAGREPPASKGPKKPTKAKSSSGKKAGTKKNTRKGR